MEHLRLIVKQAAYGEYKTKILSSSSMPARTCTVSFTDTDGIRHSVNVQAGTLYEAVVLAVRAFREHHCAPGPASQMEVEARSPSVTHTVRISKVEVWLESASKGPSEKLAKERLKGLLAS
jgi:hypothetical protein